MRVDRRTFLSVMAGGVSAAVSGKPGDATNALIPYVIPPENIRPGVWTLFATTCRECPAGCGMQVRHRDCRIVKPEGAPGHPINKGGLCPRGQSAPQGLYDPDRVRQPMQNGNGTLNPVSWETALSHIRKALENTDGSIAVLTDLQTGTLHEVMNTFLAGYTSSRLLIYEPFNYEPLRSAHGTLSGIPQIPRYTMEDCEFVLSLGADFLETWVSPVEYARQFGTFHSADRVARSSAAMVYVGPRLSMTAANADERYLVSPGRERWVGLAVLSAILDMGRAKRESEAVKTIANTLGAADAVHHSGLSEKTIRSLAERFISAHSSLALASPVAARNSREAEDAATVAMLLNVVAGGIGTTVDFSRVHAFGKTATEQETERFLENITGADVLLIHNSNIVFTRPSAATHLKRAKLVVYLSVLPDETAYHAHWTLPIDSPLESWGDYEPYTGIHSVIQPTMARVVASRSAGDVFLSLSCEKQRKNIPESDASLVPDFKERLKQRWMRMGEKSASSAASAEFWTAVLRRGWFIEQVSPVSTALKRSGFRRFTPPDTAAGGTLQLFPWPSIMLYDGRLANRGWIQESPEPVSYAVWSAWADLHPETARSLGVKHGDLIKLSNEKAGITLPVRVSDHTAPRCACALLGQGHTAGGLGVAGGIGANTFALLYGGASPGLFGAVSVHATGKRNRVVYTSPTRSQHHRDLLKTVSGSGLINDTITPEEIIYPVPEGYTPVRDLYPGHPHRKHRWVMTVDLHRCIGCGACGVACYAENNIAVMGREQVYNGREMAWLKIVPYWLGTSRRSLAWLPMLCQHCDAAPCEPVCPVYASVHNEEGLNAQIYNRCVGTRYCNNNCPYKVRRFNWFNPVWRPPLDLQLNPEVTVRCRGVMEKCTFCVQRIREVEYRAMREHRPVRDGEIQPACVQSCPTRVYTFGDLLDPNAEVTKIILKNPRRYQVLRELNTKPAVIYLKKVIHT